MQKIAISKKCVDLLVTTKTKNLQQACSAVNRAWGAPIQTKIQLILISIAYYTLLVIGGQ